MQIFSQKNLTDLVDINWFVKIKEVQLFTCGDRFDILFYICSSPCLTTSAGATW